MVLIELTKGQQATIIDLSNVSRPVQRRLLDLGVREGTTVCMRGLLPFQGPCMIEVSGQCISLRRKEAGCIAICGEGT